MKQDYAQYETAMIACERLTLKPQSLYAYVSRGLLRTIVDPEDARKSLYLTVDIDRLLVRKTRGRSRQAIATSTIDSGEPILTSLITEIKNGEFFYRGKNAVEYSQHASLEQTFCLLCDTSESNLPSAQQIDTDSARRNPFTRMLDVASKECVEANNYGSKQYAFSLLCKLVSAAAGSPYNSSEPIHVFLAKHWSDDKRAPELIRKALVLSADHELNASTYACRVAASAGVTLASSTLVGLATLSGSRHGGLTDQCFNWMRKMAPRYEASKIELSAHKLNVPPGFGQPLYPRGDPRATALIQDCKPHDSWSKLRALVFEKTGKHPSLDFGLAVLEQQLNLTRGAGFGIFAVGRTVGWMAHCFEQRQSKKIIRPRATTQ